MISSQSEGLGKMALGIVKIYLGSPFSANRRCSRSVCSRSVGSQSVCCGQLLWTLFYKLLLVDIMVSVQNRNRYFRISNPEIFESKIMIFQIAKSRTKFKM